MGEYETLTHTFEPVYNADSEILILGTFPSVKSRQQHLLRTSAKSFLESACCGYRRCAAHHDRRKESIPASESYCSLGRDQKLQHHWFQ